MAPWSRAAVWALPLLAWLGWFAYWGHDLRAEQNAMRDEAFEPGQNLSGCLDFALDNFSTPSASERAKCQERFVNDEAALVQKSSARSRHIRLDRWLLGLGAAALLPYFILVPRRRRAGVRAWLIVAALGTLLVVAALAAVITGMPHSD